MLWCPSLELSDERMSGYNLPGCWWNVFEVKERQHTRSCCMWPFKAVGIELTGQRLGEKEEHGNVLVLVVGLREQLLVYFHEKKKTALFYINLNRKTL